MQKEMEIHECTDLTTKSTQVKRLCIKEPPHARKKTKIAKTLEKEFLDSSEWCIMSLKVLWRS